MRSYNLLIDRAIYASEPGDKRAHVQNIEVVEIDGSLFIDLDGYASVKVEVKKSADKEFLATIPEKTNRVIQKTHNRKYTQPAIRGCSLTG